MTSLTLWSLAWGSAIYCVGAFIGWTVRGVRSPRSPVVADYVEGWNSGYRAGRTGALVTPHPHPLHHPMSDVDSRAFTASLPEITDGQA